jgi:hypothetical protein
MSPWLLLALVAAAGAPEQPLVWSFEDPQISWRPRAAGITLEHAPGVSATPEGKGSLRIHGRIAEGWNYALSETRPMSAGRYYKLSAWVRVDRQRPYTPAPFLKCEFVAEDGRSLGRATTESDQTARMGQWQRVEGEFEAPAGTAKCWVAVEKGTEGAMEIDAYLDDVRVEPIPTLQVFERYRFKPLPAPLHARRGIHPRLFLDTARVEQLRQAIQNTHADVWQEVRALADRAVRSGPPPYQEHDRYSGDEQLWQREVGNTMPTLAIAYLLTKEVKYLDAARAWALASCSYPTWGLGRLDGMDLATGHQLLGLALVYDWCYPDLGEEARRAIRETLARRAGKMFEAAATGRVGWRRAYLQNHLWVNICGMQAAGLALYDELDDAILWAGLPLEKLRLTIEALGPDGASHEGVAYWQYGAEYLLKLMHLSRELLATDLYDHPWWKNTAAYALYLSLPRQVWTRRNCIVDIADCPRGNWYGPDYILRALAREYRDGHAQWLAAEVDAANIDSPGARWLNLIWLDPEVPARPPTPLPTLRHFEDMGIVSARTDWSGNESLLVFKCGPFIGHHAVEAFDYDPGGGHVHPDANHFVLFGAGEWLIRDDGYLPKATEHHNTLLVDGKGQLGEGKMWLAGSEALAVKSRPRILQARSTATLDHLVGDATEAYPEESGLRRYVRHLFFLKPDVLIVADEIVTDQPRALELRFHPERPAARGEEGAFLARGEKSALRIEVLTPEGAEVTAEELPARSQGHRQGGLLPTIRVRAERQEWRNAVALSWSDAGSTPARVTMKAEGDRWTFAAKGQTITLDWREGRGDIAR